MTSRIRWLKRIDGTVGAALVAGVSRLGRVLSPRPGPERITSVLVIRPGGLGDAVLLLPALAALKATVNPGRIDVLAESRNAAVFSLADSVTETYRYERPLDLLRILNRSYDVVIDTEQWHRLSAVIARLTRAPVRIGFATNERARLFTHPVAYSQASYEADSFLGLIAALTGAPIAFDPATPFITARPQGAGRDRSRPVVVLFPGASVAERRWGGERFGELAARLARHGCQIVVVGGAGDVEQGREICSIGGPRVSNLAGALSLKDVSEVFAGADIMVTADSGLMHLAVAVGTPTVSLFGAGIRDKWAPRGGMHRVLNAGLPCSPCTAFGYTPPCRIGVECLQVISVDEVLAATLEVMDRGMSRGMSRGRQGMCNATAA